MVVVPENGGEGETGEAGLRRKRRKFKNMSVPTEEMEFVSALERADMQRLDMEQTKFDLERRFFEENCENRKHKRLERKEERAAAAKFELKRCSSCCRW